MSSRINESGAKETSFPFGGSLSDFSKLLMIGPHVQAATMKGLLAQQRELFDFMGRRCDADSQLVEKIGTATTMTDVAAAYMDFWRNAATQYAAEARQLTERASQEVMESVQAAQKEVAGSMENSLRAAA